MKTDRELLELAAKAAGITISAWKPNGWALVKFHGGEQSCMVSPWNSLENDGDALRLAVKIGIGVEAHPEWIYTRARYPGKESWEDYLEPHNSDPYAATRRAITRAAAAISEQQNELSREA